MASSSSSPIQLRASSPNVEAGQIRCQQVPASQTIEDQTEFAKSYARNSICTSKYTPITWLPKSVFEQFRRLANVYFMVMSILMLIGTYASQIFDSPYPPWSTLGPLALVMGVTSIREALEDWERHKSDRLVNTSEARVLKPQGETGIPWEDVAVGDIVLVKNRESFPADLVVVATASDDGICYIETSNIDGETNLKIRERVAGVNTKESKTLSATMEWESPNKSIYTFTGSLSVASGVMNGLSTAVGWSAGKHKTPLDAKNLLLRGSVLRNTPWVHGLVVYTGAETKLMMNSIATPSKLSKIERTVNRMLWILLLVQVSPPSFPSHGHSPNLPCSFTSLYLPTRAHRTNTLMQSLPPCRLGSASSASCASSIRRMAHGVRSAPQQPSIQAAPPGT
jgi:magnesium-transporting ATPase (P-type)